MVFAERLHAGFFAAHISKRSVNMRIEALEQFERVAELARRVKMRNPEAHDVALLRIAGETVRYELRLFVSGVLERIRQGVWINDKVEGILKVMSNDKLAKEAEFCAGTGKVEYGD
jgi:hypothetical protein